MYQGSIPAPRQEPLRPGCVFWRFLGPFGMEMGLPMDCAAASAAFKLSFSSLQLQLFLAWCRRVPPCSISPPEGAGYQPPSPGVANPSHRWQHSKQSIFSGKTVAALGRALEARRSFCISQQCSFLNLFRFFAALQHFCLVFSLRSITPPTPLCGAASLPASPCIYLAFLPLPLPRICSVEPCTCLGEHPPVFPGSISNQDCFAL